LHSFRFRKKNAEMICYPFSEDARVRFEGIALGEILKEDFYLKDRERPVSR